MKTLVKIGAIPLAVLIWFTLPSVATYIHRLSEWFYSLGKPEQIVIVCTAVSTVVLAVVTLLPYLRDVYRNRKSVPREPFPYRIVSSADELYSELGIPTDRLQTYVE